MNTRTPTSQHLPSAPVDAAVVQEVIRIDKLRFRWKPDTPLVLAIDQLCVDVGERVFVEGPSGSGKSTLLNLLAGVTVPQAGSIQVLGHQLEGMPAAARDHFRADHVGFIFQMFNLIPYLSIVDNVALPCRFSAKRRSKATAQSGSVEAEARRLLAHLDLADPALLARSVVELSVGQQQRVAAARALMGSPELIIADEPTSSLDTDRRAAFVRLLFDECRQSGATIVFVSHDRTLEPLFDRRVLLNKINRANGESHDPDR